MTNFDLIVIGGGVSGITAAAYAARAGRHVLLLEAADRLGGCVHTWRPVEDFWLELGAHTAYNSYGALLALHGEAGFADLIPRAKVGYHFLANGKPQSPFARLRLLEAAMHMPFGLSQDKAGKDLETYYGRLLGPGNWRRLLSPAFAAVLSQPAEPYPAEWLFKRKPRRKDAPRKFTHAGGLQGWLEWLATANGVEVRLSAPVVEVAVEGGGVRLRLEDGELRAQQAVVAAPVNTAADLLRNFVPELAKRLAVTPAARIETCAAILPADRVRLPPVAGLIGGDDVFYSAVSRDYLPHPQWRGFAFHFKPGRLDAAGKRRRMAEVLGCAPEDFVHETEKVNVLPALTPPSVQLAVELRLALSDTPVRLAGNYLDGLSMGDAAQYAAELW